MGCRAIGRERERERERDFERVWKEAEKLG
jgi:hypothetical protein